MKSRQECKVVEVKKDSIVVLLLDEKKKIVSKDLVQFEVLVGDELWLTFDNQENITKVEQKDFSRAYNLSNEKGEDIEVFVSPAREIE